MDKRVLLGTVVGGVVLFFWGFVWHAVLPFAVQTLQPFSNEDQLAALIVAGTSRSGTHVIPKVQPGADAAQAKAMEERGMRGPMVVAAVRLGSFNFPKALMIQFGITLLAAFLGTWLVTVARPTTLSGRVGFLVIVALAGWTMHSLPSWNWYSFGIDYILCELIDVVVGFGLLGVVIHKVVEKTA
jgi:hypothetical protein